MKESTVLLGYADLIENTDKHLKKHFILFSILGLIAGLGSFVLEGGWGNINAGFHTLLEVIVNLARLLIIFAVIGRGQPLPGFNHFLAIFRLRKSAWSDTWSNFKNNVRHHFLAILVNLIIYVIVAVITNIAIFATLKYTPLLNWLKSADLISQAAGKWPVILLLKNISIIPFTLVFATLLVMWIVERNKTIEE
ncbi:hypothetical protein [Emticicia sp. TH156]|uniref:hypothetical protein n=1 Tax=Emticicia sp. TH156 TaxID=2067454 RepID=UPI000C77F755|nr:hypothetical protein [Emticicia sp. TH156]PLK46040.1 hypothetical protein C0V77_01430 [Emticicia sp. TH156]